MQHAHKWLKQRQLMSKLWTEQDWVALSFRNTSSHLIDRKQSRKGEMDEEITFVLLFLARQCLFRTLSIAFGLMIQNIVYSLKFQIGSSMHGHFSIITKATWVEVFPPISPIEFYLFVLPHLVFLKSAPKKGSLSIKMSRELGCYGGVIGKEMT